MTEIELFLLNANRCRELALIAQTNDSKEQYGAAADAWHDLAKTREDLYRLLNLLRGN